MHIWQKLNSRSLYRLTFTTVAMQVAFLAIQAALIATFLGGQISGNERVVETVALLMGISALVLVA